MEFTELTTAADLDDALGTSAPTSSNGTGNGTASTLLSPEKQQAPADDTATDDDFTDDDTAEDDDDDKKKDLTEEFCERCFRELFSNGVGWIEAGGRYFSWQDTHYAEVTEQQLRKTVAHYARSFEAPVFDADGGIIGFTRPFAKPGHVGPAIKWLTDLVSIQPERLNPSGLVNCTNGVLRIQWKRGKPVPVLEPHDPEQHYLVGKPVVAYQPDADPTEAERLLECVDPEGKELLFEVLGAAMDLQGLSENGGARVPALLQIGDGENGKDTVNKCAELVLGSTGVAAISLRNWRQHDDGQGSGRFNIYQLVGARLCLSSENSQFFKLDELQSLKAAITNDSIYVEEKGIQGFRYQPWCAFIWNLNKEPLIDGAQAAVLTRYGVVRYPFTYARNPKPGQKQADTRFKNSPKWVQSEVLPAFLNLMVAGLQRAASQGFSLAKVENALHSIRKGTSHLWQFIEDVGYEKGGPDDYIHTKEVWCDLARWYRDNGWLDHHMMIPERGTECTHMSMRFSQSEDGDKPVKALKDVGKRLQVLFPGSQLDRDSSKGRAAILRGIRKQQAPAEAPPTSEAAKANAPQRRSRRAAKSSASSKPSNSGNAKAA